jgi:hypothetical protein
MILRRIAALIGVVLAAVALAWLISRFGLPFVW